MCFDGGFLLYASGDGCMTGGARACAAVRAHGHHHGAYTHDEVQLTTLSHFITQVVRRTLLGVRLMSVGKLILCIYYIMYCKQLNWLDVILCEMYSK